MNKKSTGNSDCLLTGQAEAAAGKNTASEDALTEKFRAAVHENPEAARAVGAFLDLLGSKCRAEAPSATTSATENWIPIVGRTAAGVPQFWREANPLPPMKPPSSSAIVGTTEGAMESADVEVALTGPIEVKIVQLNTPDDRGVTQFIDCPELRRRINDAFALRIDGDSMSPRIDDADLVILSPSHPGSNGRPAVVRLHNQIGLTCKIIRRESGRLHLIPINEHYSPRTVPEDQVDWSLSVLHRVRVSPAP